MRRSERGIVLLVGVLVVTFSACGDNEKRGDEERGDPVAVAPVKSADSGGEYKKNPPAAAAAVQPAPAPRPAEEPKVDGPPPKPATLKELLAVIDLRKFPVMEGAEATTQSPLGSHMRVPKADKATLLRAVEFYRAKLTEAGWKPSADPGLSQTYEQGAQLHFEKSGYTIYASMGLSRGFEEGTHDLNGGLFYLGNLDARRLPRMAGAKVTSAVPERVIYETASTLDEIKKFLREELTKQGWMEIDRPDLPGVPRHLTKSGRELRFMQGAGSIDFHFTEEKDTTGVSSSVAVLEAQLPILADAMGIEFDMSPLILFYKTATPFEQAVEFHRKELSALGWKERDGAGKNENGRAILVFDMSENEPLRLDVLGLPKGSAVQIKRWTAADDAAG